MCSKFLVERELPKYKDYGFGFCEARAWHIVDAQWM